MQIIGMMRDWVSDSNDVCRAFEQSKKPLKCTPQIGKFYDCISFKGWNFIPTVMTSKKGLVLLGDVGQGCHICAGSCTDKGWLGAVQKVKVLTEATCSGKKAREKRLWLRCCSYLSTDVMLKQW